MCEWRIRYNEEEYKLLKLTISVSLLGYVGHGKRMDESELTRDVNRKEYRPETDQ